MLLPGHYHHGPPSHQCDTVCWLVAAHILYSVLVLVIRLCYWTTAAQWLYQSGASAA